MYIDMLKNKKYLVIIDDAHKVIESEAGSMNIDTVQEMFDYVILLSSQGPLHSDFKGLKDSNKICLYELPHIEAIA